MVQFYQKIQENFSVVFYNIFKIKVFRPELIFVENSKHTTTFFILNSGHKCNFFIRQI